VRWSDLGTSQKETAKAKGTGLAASPSAAPAESPCTSEDQIEKNDDYERYAHQPQKNACHANVSVSAVRTWNNLATISFREHNFSSAATIGGNVMARNPAIAVTEVEEVVVSAAPASAAAGFATDWGAIIGGALCAIAISIILFTAGSGFGVSTVEPWSFANRAPETFAIGAAIWLIVMQWLSAGFGGYLAGRLRAKWIGPRTDEVLFRDTAHGLLAWALATLIVAALFTLGTLGTSAALIATEGAPGAANAAQAAATLTEEARKAAANFSIVTAISLLVGAFIGAVAGGLGGYDRDAA
jgi:hypothetical protein